MLDFLGVSQDGKCVGKQNVRFSTTLVITVEQQLSSCVTCTQTTVNFHMQMDQKAELNSRKATGKLLSNRKQEVQGIVLYHA